MRYTPHKPHSDGRRLRVARVSQATHTAQLRHYIIYDREAKIEPGSVGAL